jgi:secreted trypsin-like serine protease
MATTDVETFTPAPTTLVISKENKSWLDNVSTRTIMWALLGSSALGVVGFLSASSHAVLDPIITQRALSDAEKPQEPKDRAVSKIIAEKLAAYQAAREKEGFNSIVGGDVTTISNTPWQVALVDYDEDYWQYFIGQNYFQFCGGSIIDESWIATAAHCVDDPVFWQYFRITAGNTYIYGEDGTGLAEEQFIPVSEVYVHHSYDDWYYYNDIALLKLATPLKMKKKDDKIEKIEIDGRPHSSWPAAGTDAVISGWGTTSFEGYISNQIKSATIDVLTNPSDPTCGLYPQNEYIPSMMLCAGTTDGGVDSCQGDSGGPLAIYDGKRKKWFLGGITSWGYGCAEMDYPGVYTRVSSYVKWIDLIESDRNNLFTVSVNGGGFVTSNPEGINCDSLCNTKFSKNKEVVLTANPYLGEEFLGWSGACSGTSPQCTVKVKDATSVGAAFSSYSSSAVIEQFRRKA